MRTAVFHLVVRITGLYAAAPHLFDPALALASVNASIQEQGL